jgi:hypothetical protein
MTTFLLLRALVLLLVYAGWVWTAPRVPGVREAGLVELPMSLAVGCPNIGPVRQVDRSSPGALGGRFGAGKGLPGHARQFRSGARHLLTAVAIPENGICKLFSVGIQKPELRTDQPPPPGKPRPAYEEQPGTVRAIPAAATRQRSTDCCREPRQPPSSPR